MGEKPGQVRGRKEDAWQGMALHTTMKVSETLPIAVPPRGL
jgi:hypothetical protein